MALILKRNLLWFYFKPIALIIEINKRFKENAHYSLITMGRRWKNKEWYWTFNGFDFVLRVFQIRDNGILSQTIKKRKLLHLLSATKLFKSLFWEIDVCLIKRAGFIWLEKDNKEFFNKINHVYDGYRFDYV